MLLSIFLLQAKVRCLLYKSPRQVFPDHMESKTRGSLHDTVKWYKLRHAGWQKNATASKTKRFQLAKRDFSLLLMSQCVACHPTGQILYHLTVSCKGPIGLPFLSLSPGQVAQGLHSGLP